MIRKKIFYSIAMLAISGIGFVGCGSTDSSSNTNTSVSTPNVTGLAIAAQPVSADPTTGLVKSLFSSNQCLSGTINVSGSDWWASSNISIANSCNYEVDLAKESVSFNSQDMSGKPIDVGTFNNWWVNDAQYSLTFKSASNGKQVASLSSSKTTVSTADASGDNDEVGAFSSTNGKAVIKAAQTIKFDGGFNLFGSPYNTTLAQQTFTISGSVPPKEYGNLNVVVNTVNAGCSSGVSCDGMNIKVLDSLGSEKASFNVPSSSFGGTYSQKITNLASGESVRVVASAINGANINYIPGDSAKIVTNQTANIEVDYNKTAPVVLVGNANITMPIVVPNYTGNLELQIINTQDNSVAASYSLAQGSTVKTENLPVSDAKHTYVAKLLNGIADPLNGLYYIENGLPTVTITAKTTTDFTVPMKKSGLPTSSATLDILGLKSGDSANVGFSSAGSTYKFVSYTNQKNSSTVYKFETGMNVGATIKASSDSYITNPINFTGIITQNIVVPAKFEVKPTPPLSSATYDYIAPFKDYNNEIQLSINNLASAKTLSFTSNFQQKDGWGTCFGQSVYDLNFSTVQSGSNYTTTITPKTSSASLDLTKTCDIMGTDSGNAVVLPGVVDPIVYSVTADGKQLNITQPCAATGCKDPGNGFVNVGYYAEWSVWGRQYNPYLMPFDSINDIIFAFVGFNPADGSIKALDTSADSWGLSAISRALLQYPYMKAHLSFGGWTNNGNYTAPMFEQLASSQASMDNFANQSIALMRKTGFSGIDIDWEWWSSYSNSVAPSKKMLALYKTLRVALDKAGAEDGKKYTLTIAVNGGSDRILAMQNPSNPNSVSDFWAQVGTIMDHINVMNYDYHGSFDVGNPAYFQANFDFSNTSPYNVGKDSGWSIKSSTDTYKAQGVPAKKLVVGIPLYARTMTVSSTTNGGLFQTVTGAGFGDWENGILDYKCIVNPVFNPLTGCGSEKPIADIKNLTYYSSTSNTTLFNQYGKGAMQPWAYSPLSNSFMSYDDIWSATAKAGYVKDNNLGGTMYWELDGDSQTPDKSIVKAVKDFYNK